MSTPIVTIPRQVSTAPTTLRRQPTASASLRLDSAFPTAVPTSFEVEFSFFELDTAFPTPSATATDVSIDPVTTSPVAGSAESCSADNECATDRICNDGRCVDINDAAPLGGPGSEPTSHLNTASAIGVVIGVVAFIAVMIGFGFWFWRLRGRRPPEDSIEAPPNNRNRSASNATTWTVENDQKTLVASLPNSPQNAAFREQQGMQPEFFAKAVGFSESRREKAEYRRHRSLDDERDSRSIATEKALPPPPTDNPLPSSPTEQRRYALNVNINKSMIFDEDMIRAVSPVRDSGTPRERAPRYRFEEYLPHVKTTPPISIAPRPASSKQSSEYELEQYPKARRSSEQKSTADGSTDDETEPQSPRDKALSKLESTAPQLPLPELPPPSPSFSFRSYDWYQDIIGDQSIGDESFLTVPPRSPARTPTPTQTAFPSHLALPPNSSDVNPSLFPVPPTQATSPQFAAPNLHPRTATLPSPTNANFRLSPTVYQAPTRSPRLPPLPPAPPTPPPKSSRVSALSTMTRKTHNSRSWLPEDGLYLPEDGTIDSYKRFRRPSDANKPTSYSPLS
ncbi:hypothetical protein BKA66DRAFT_574397 [Pyrenochaeta sp. MPI-SDFR-AT-0127]|nr:hypothetical protein BKA66DRAFT_574397 [Pyrenochaeta sp. MPI-SDFR-AT-0127]